MERIQLHDRTEVHVKEYFYRVQDAEIRRMIPIKAQTLAQALDDYHRSRLPGSTSYGCAIYADGSYVGDVWCYCMDTADNPRAMLSYCLFAKEYWGRGIATAGVNLFLQKVEEEFGITKIGAFTYNDNSASIGVLTNCGFQLVETFVEDGVASSYFALDTAAHRQS